MSVDNSRVAKGYGAADLLPRTREVGERSAIWIYPHIELRGAAGHVQYGLRPAEALRKTQLWLRHLRVGEYRHLVDAALAAKPNEKVKVRLLELAEALAKANAMSRPFGHPYYWGRFALYGA